MWAYPHLLAHLDAGQRLWVSNPMTKSCQENEEFCALAQYVLDLVTKAQYGPRIATQLLVYSRGSNNTGRHFAGKMRY